MEKTRRKTQHIKLDISNEKIGATIHKVILISTGALKQYMSCIISAKQYNNLNSNTLAETVSDYLVTTKQAIPIEITQSFYTSTMGDEVIGYYGYMTPLYYKKQQLVIVNADAFSIPVFELYLTSKISGKDIYAKFALILKTTQDKFALTVTNKNKKTIQLSRHKTTIFGVNELDENTVIEVVKLPKDEPLLKIIVNSSMICISKRATFYDLIHELDILNSDILTPRSSPLDDYKILCDSDLVKNYNALIVSKTFVTIQIYSEAQQQSLTLKLPSRDIKQEEDVSKNNFNTTQLPSWRAISAGLSIEGLCENEDCIAYTMYVMSTHGFVPYDFTFDERKGKCPECNQSILTKSVGLLNCSYTFIGSKIGPTGQLVRFRDVDIHDAGTTEYLQLTDELFGKYQKLYLLCEERFEFRKLASTRCLLCTGRTELGTTKELCSVHFVHETCAEEFQIEYCIFCEADETNFKEV